MTREEILALSPGRELDALVADKVMGLKWEAPTRFELVGYWKADDYMSHKNKDWSPSTDISAAWDVLKEISKKKLAWRIEGLIVAIFDPYAGSPADDGSRTYEEVVGNRTEEAICKAALLAVIT